MVASKLAELLERWDSPEGRPYKGSLIDWEAYQADPDNIGCACAQGQVLWQFAGWEPERIRDTNQAEADAEVAKLLNISRAHAILLRHVNDSIYGAPSIVLTDPGKVLGDQWSKLLDFWHYMDTMTAEQWDAAGDAAGAAARAAAGAAARAAAWAAAGAAAWAAAGDAAGAAAGDAAGAAAWEIQGAAIFKAENRPFYFLPLFGFDSPDSIPPRPADYGQVA